MARQREREQALLLRNRGKSIGDIASQLSVSKSTVSNWCRDIRLSEKQRAKLATLSKHHATAALLRASEHQREQRLKHTEHMISVGQTDVGKCTKRDLFMVGLGLYWGEGYKKGNQELGFTNSDPQMISFYIRWLKTIYGIGNDELILRVSINTIHTKRVKEVEKYWSKLTSIPISQFTKPSLIRSKSEKMYRDQKHHFGTLRIKVRRGTDLRRRILGSISAL